MPKVDVEGEWVLVTGGGTRVGAAIGRELAAAGYNLLVHYATNRGGANTVAESARQLGRRSHVIQADLTDRQGVDVLAKASLEKTGGGLGLLVNNAANFERVEPSELTQGHWDRALALNATAPYALTMAFSDALRASHGSMVAIACVSALRPWKRHIPYAVSKAALLHLVRGLAVGLAPEVRVNAVAPGAVMLPDDHDDDVWGNLRRKIPLRRFGQPEDVARAVRFLAENDYVTGQLLVVDGGLSLT